MAKKSQLDAAILAMKEEITAKQAEISALFVALGHMQAQQTPRPSARSRKPTKAAEKIAQAMKIVDDATAERMARG